MTKRINQALIVCKEKTDLHTLRSHVLNSHLKNQITEIETATQALAHTKKLILAREKMPELVFLDTSCRIDDSNAILCLLDNYSPEFTSKTVYLINRQFSQEKIIELGKFKCVQDILTAPILKYDLPTEMGRVSILA